MKLNPLLDQAKELFAQHLCYAEVGRRLGITRERARQIAVAVGECERRKAERTTLVKLESLRLEGKVTSHVVRGIAAWPRSRLSELMNNLSEPTRAEAAMQER
jgi:hypothetical protein